MHSTPFPLVLPILSLASLAMAQSNQFVLLKDITPSFDSTYTTPLVELDGRHYFLGGPGLFRTDGTAAGTILAVDLSSQGYDGTLAAAAGLLWFGSGVEPWVSDGTPAGTRLVADIYPGTGGSSPTFFTDLGEQCAFLAETPQGWHLVVSDGTTAGTRVVAPARDPQQIYRPVLLGGRLYFTGRDTVTGTEPWTYDLATQKAQILKDVAPGVSNSEARFIGAAHGLAWFSVTYAPARGIWTSDGTEAGTTLATNRGEADFSVPAGPAVVATKTKAFLRLRSGNELIAWDAATRQVTLISANTLVSAYSMCALGDACVFLGTTRTSQGIWRTDGTVAGTVQVKAIQVHLTAGLRQAGSRHAMFIGYEAASGYELWRTDGTAAGTVLHVEVGPGSVTGYPATSTMMTSGVVNGGFFWNARHQLYGDEPTWTTLDGLSTPIGTSCRQPAMRLHGTDTVLGGKMVLDGEGAHVNSVAVLFIGAWGTTPVPVNARCRYYLDPVVSFPLIGFVVTAPSWSVTMPMPSDAALLGVRAAFQIGYAGGMVPGGLMMTNAVFSQLGR